MRRRVVALVSPGSLKAYRWARQALIDVRRELPTGGVKVVVQPPPPLPRRGVVAVRLALRARHATCLERSLVLQRWFATTVGYRTDVVIGVATADGFTAHAWLDQVDRKVGQDTYTELMRVPPPSG